MLRKKKNGSMTGIICVSTSFSLRIYLLHDLPDVLLVIDTLDFLVVLSISLYRISFIFMSINSKSLFFLKNVHN